MIEERFGVSVEFDEGSIVYRETISRTAEGVGHFEPLRHDRSSPVHPSWHAQSTRKAVPAEIHKQAPEARRPPGAVRA